MHELTPSIVQEVLNIGLRHVTIPLIRVIKTAIGPRGPHHLRHRFGKHTPVLLAGLDPLCGLFLLINVSTCRNPVQDRALRIFVRNTSRKEPAIVPCSAILDAKLHPIGGTCAQGGLPRILYSLLIIRVDELEPSVPLYWFRGHASIVAPPSVTVLSRAVRAQDPDKVWDDNDQGAKLFFLVLPLSVFMEKDSGAFVGG